MRAVLLNSQLKCKLNMYVHCSHYISSTGKDKLSVTRTLPSGAMLLSKERKPPAVFFWLTLSLAGLSTINLEERATGKRLKP